MELGWVGCIPAPYPLRLPEMMIEELKLLVNKMDVPYQTLIKIFLSERIRKELEYANS